MFRRLAIVLALILGCAWYAQADKADSSKADSSADSAKAEYEKILDEWRERVGKMRGLQERFQVATSGEATRLTAEYGQLLTTGMERAHLLPEAAERYYIAAPNKDRGVIDFLYATLNDAMQTDNYEDASRISKLLVANMSKDKSLYAKVGLSAFAVNDYPTARKYLQMAADLGELDQRGKNSQAELDNYEKLWKREVELRKEEEKQNDLPRVTLTTTKGDIVLELFENEAPIATANFLALVEKHFYNGTKFHRVIPTFMAQGGDPMGNGTGGPGYFIPGEESNPKHRAHFRGSLSMAHTGDANTGGSQFFLTFNPTPALNGKHTVFGRVIEGMDVLSRLQRTEAQGQPSKSPQDSILYGTVLRKRDHPYEFETLPAR